MNHEDFLKFLNSPPWPSCGRCWWREGRKCYHEVLGPCPARPQDITAELWTDCDAAKGYLNSRATLMKALPQVLLAVAAQTLPPEQVVPLCNIVIAAQDLHDTDGQKGT